MGAVLGAVSPAVVVPRMVQLMEEKYGTKKRIPQMILAGASLDDVFVIVLFTALTGMAQGNTIRISDFVGIPVSIVLGLLVGGAAGYCLAWFFEAGFADKNYIRNSMKVMILLGVSFLMLALEELLEPVVPFSGLLAVMSMSMLLARRSAPPVTRKMQEKFGRLWIAAEVVLFVLVGAAVDIRYTFASGIGVVGMILIGLAFRSIGVLLCMAGTNLNGRERLYSVLAYLPKATVQAAIGSVPLAMGLPCGKLVLSAAVLSIVIAAPIGAFAMDFSYRKLLEQEPTEKKPPLPQQA